MLNGKAGNTSCEHGVCSTMFQRAVNYNQALKVDFILSFFRGACRVNTSFCLSVNSERAPSVNQHLC